MLALNSPRWGQLQDAYGKATRIPELLQKLSALPGDEDDEEPWFSLWSALAHQGDVYPASFAAVPHVVEALAAAPHRASEVYFHFPAWVEVCRHKHAVKVPDDLKPAYFEALARMPALAAAAASRPWSTALTACALSAIAAAKGQHEQAEVLLEMSSPDTTDELLEWLHDR